ncbi:MAG: hypothetical protein ABJD97_06160 [Betaproteobacteria bacterium]
MNTRHALAAVAAALLASPALASTELQRFNFTQGGYANGAVSGTFSGIDANDDGVLTTPEMTDFQFNFFATDGSYYQSLAVPVDQMFDGGSFEFRLDDLVLGDAPGEHVAAGIGGSHTAGFSFLASSAGGTFISRPGFPVGTTVTTEWVQVTVAPGIPELPTATLMLAALGVLGLRRRFAARR